MAEPEFHSHSGAKLKELKAGLEWAIDAGTPTYKSCLGGEKTWQEASDYVICLNAHKYLGHDDWRLPSTHELTRLVSRVAAGTNQKTSRPGMKSLGIKNLQSSLYWSSGYMSDGIALAVDILVSGESHPVNVMNTLYVWPVRTSQKEGH
jgi:hypothetical protein